MKKVYLFLFLMVILITPIRADHICYSHLHAGIKAQVEEDQLQTELLKEQGKVVASDALAKDAVTRVEKNYTKTQKRLKALTTVIDGTFLLNEAMTRVNSIMKNQERLINEIKKHPELALTILESEASFLKEAQLVVDYFLGVAMSGSTIYQMDNTDRKVIFDFIINELTSLDVSSRNTYMTVVFAKQSLSVKKAIFQHDVMREYNLMKEIIDNAKSL